MRNNRDPTPTIFGDLLFSSGHRGAATALRYDRKWSVPTPAASQEQQQAERLTDQLWSLGVEPDEIR